MPSINELQRELAAIEQCFDLESRNRRQWYETARKRGDELAAKDAELAALRKQVEEGERDTARLTWLATRMFLSPTVNYLVSTNKPLRVAIDAAMAADPESQGHGLSGG